MHLTNKFLLLARQNQKELLQEAENQRRTREAYSNHGEKGWLPQGKSLRRTALSYDETDGEVSQLTPSRRTLTVRHRVRP